MTCDWLEPGHRCGESARSTYRIGEAVATLCDHHAVVLGRLGITVARAYIGWRREERPRPEDSPCLSGTGHCGHCECCPSETARIAA